MDNLPDWGWLLFAYGVGTAFGLWINVTFMGERVVGSTIDALIANGYLKHRKNAEGEIEILKYNEE